MMKAIGALMALSLCMLPVRAQANDVEIYYQGSVMNFGLAAQRIVCDSLDAIHQMIHEVRQLGEKQAYRLLRRPLKTLPNGTFEVREEIARLPIASGLIRASCTQAPPQLFIAAATHIQWLDGHEVVTTFVFDSLGRAHVTYFFDIRVLLPMPGTKEAAQLDAVTKAFASATATPKSQVGEGVWRWEEVPQQ